MDNVLNWIWMGIKSLGLAVFTGLFAPKVIEAIKDWHRLEYKRYPNYWHAVFGAQLAFLISAGEMAYFVLYGDPHAPGLWGACTMLAGQIVSAWLYQAFADKFFQE